MDIITIVEKLESMGYIRANKIINAYYSIYCPFHNQGQERKASFGILIEEEVRHGKVYPTGWSHCFTCGYVNPLPKFISDLLESRSIHQDGIDWLKDNIVDFEGQTNFEYLIPPDMSDQLLSQWDQSKLAVDKLMAMTQSKRTFITEDELARYRFTVPYMYERRLTDAVIEKYDVGFDQHWISPGRKTPTPCLTFPVHNEFGEVLYIYRRAISTKFFCLSGDTLIVTLVDNVVKLVTIKELAEDGNKFKVLSYDSDKGMSLLKSGIAFKSGVRDLVKVTLSNGSYFTCTPDHKVFIDGKGSYRVASDLKGCSVFGHGGELVCTDVKQLVGIHDVYDITVEGTHCFWISPHGATITNIFALVHNSMPEGEQKVVYGLYQLPKDAKRIVVTEAILNALTAITYGDNAVALYGTGNAHQIDQLRKLGASEFVLAFDPDEGGRRATAKLKKALRDVAIVWSYADIPEGKDINNLSFQEYKALTLE